MNPTTNIQVEPRIGYKLVREVKGNREEWRYIRDYNSEMESWGISYVWVIIIIITIVLLIAWKNAAISENKNEKNRESIESLNGYTSK